LTLIAQRLGINYIIAHIGPMQHGRIVRVTTYVTYVVAEEDAAKAVDLLKRAVEPDSRVEAIGRASLQILRSMALAPGQFQKVEP
jgi:hypothetical protein